MARRPRILLGNFGNGTFGMKTSTSEFDVTVLADDNDPVKRSFNSQWPNIAKLKMIGVARSEWTQYQYQTPVYNQWSEGSTTWAQSASISAWQQVSPVAVPTGLTGIPIWEERIFDPATGAIYDDFLYSYAGPSGYPSSYSGARSFHSGPATSPANTLFFTPYLQNPNAAMVANVAVSARFPAFSGPYIPPPPYPAFPPKPSAIIASVYVVYANPMGVVS